MTRDAEKFLIHLQRSHVGRGRARTAEWIRQNPGPLDFITGDMTKKDCQRTLNALAQELRDAGYPIGRIGGYYWPNTDAELQEERRQFVGPAKVMLKRARVYKLALMAKRQRTLFEN